ncbi:umecyanin [Ziziphus jujuba]|uniref:Umecyanin n=1 Tax=Ziziphus jujuba TaxID=326968 RepID=A0A6P4AKA1_ZIZJJ|nr:umecyanin [Ziziphus jujuba]
MANLKLSLIILAATMGCFMMATSVNAMTHIVGGSHGWRVPDNKTYFEDWARPRTFGVGDRLLFPSRPSANNVVIVDKDDFEHCTQNHVISMFFDGPVIVNLTRTGDYYFYNGLGKHCEAGHKLHIKVENKEGSSGEEFPFKLVGHLEMDSFTAAPVPAPSQSSANTVRNFGVVSGLITLLIWMFI